MVLDFPTAPDGQGSYTRPMTTTPETSSPTHAWGIGLATLAADGSTLDVWYPAPNPGPAQEAPEAHPLYAQLESADRKSTRLNSSHVAISYAVFCLKKTNQ